MSYELDKHDFVSVYPSWIVWNISKWYFEKNCENTACQRKYVYL